jgi:hypothetical protein
LGCGPVILFLIQEFNADLHDFIAQYQADDYMSCTYELVLHYGFGKSETVASDPLSELEHDVGVLDSSGWARIGGQVAERRVVVVEPMPVWATD